MPSNEHELLRTVFVDYNRVKQPNFPDEREVGESVLFISIRVFLIMDFLGIASDHDLPGVKCCMYKVERKQLCLNCDDKVGVPWTWWLRVAWEVRTLSGTISHHKHWWQHECPFSIHLFMSMRTCAMCCCTFYVVSVAKHPELHWRTHQIFQTEE